MTGKEGDEGIVSWARSGHGSGEWVTPAVSYVDPVRRVCAYCGRPIARRYWREPVGETGGSFCDPAHAARHTTYPKKPHTNTA